MSALQAAADTPLHQTRSGGLVIRQVGALVGYTVREARHKWTLVALFALTTFFLLMLATLVNVDVVEGTIASARLFGTMDLPLGNQTIPVSDAVMVIQAIVSWTLSTFGLILALFISGNIIPRTLTPGWVDLLVAQPIARTTLLLGRALGTLAVVSLSIVYLFGGSWAILTWKTGFGNAGFLAAGGIILFTFLVCYGGMVLVGVVTRNSPVSIIVGVGLWALGWILYPLHAFDEWTTAFRAGLPRSLAAAIAETLYWALPKTAELTWQAGIATGQPGERSAPQVLSFAPMLWSLPFAVVCLALACWWFSRQDY